MSTEDYEEEKLKEKLKKQIFSKILPSKYFQYLTYIFLLLVISPLVLIIISPNVIKDPDLVLPLFLTMGGSIIVYCFLVGILLINMKIPFVKEWKDKLGYLK
ncbi:MAG: hypothetical protein H7A23_24640 [Leptospiraceae bacterium]|nr:hypothetical protein [Leptospiraceae bacterium]MCP5497754.1 hypothetical protein [Leptospiraceae bacterium]